jgi:hypothetical protein
VIVLFETLRVPWHHGSPLLRPQIEPDAADPAVPKRGQVPEFLAVLSPWPLRQSHQAASSP